MAKKSERIGKGIKIKKYDDIFDVPKVPEMPEMTEMTDEDVKNEDNANGAYGADGGAVFVDPALLKEFDGHPFKVVGKGIDELMDSIREQGILSPLIVRPVKPVNGADGQFEIISGHRRRYCAVSLGIDSVPVIVRDIGDDEAVLAMVDSNIQREDILPSEKAFAYKMKLEAIKRQGKRTDLTCRQVVDKLKSADIIGKKSNESGRQIQRYVRITELPAPLLDAIDHKKMSFNAGVELSYLNDDDRKAVAEAATGMRRYPTLAQAKKIREFALGADGVTVDEAAVILLEKEKNKDDELVDFDRADIREFFPKQFTARQIEEAVIELLRKHKGVGSKITSL